MKDDAAWLGSFFCNAKRLGVYKRGKLSRKAAIDTFNGLYQEFRSEEIPSPRKLDDIKMMVAAVKKQYGYDLVFDDRLYNVPFKMSCPYCGNLAEYVKSSCVYGSEHGGMRYYCKKCDASVGTHKGTAIPLGTMANKELRQARKTAHENFDVLWAQYGKDARTRMYRTLANWMHLPTEKCHIGGFTLAQCKDVLEFCREFDEI